MKEPSSRRYRGLLARAGLAVLGLLIAAIAAGLSLRAASSVPAPPGGMIEVGGVALHLDCRGDRRGRPVMVIEAGQGMSSRSYHWLQSELASSVRVCRYDRAGLGFSDAADDNRHPNVVIEQLRALLSRAGERPPYVLAGHSMGGLLARIHAGAHPRDVAALVLIDASHPEMERRLALPAPPTTLLRVGALAADLGLLHLARTVVSSRPPRDGLPEHLPSSTATARDSARCTAR